MAARFKLNSAGVKEILNGDIARKACRPAAERALAAAQSGAKVDSGEYQDSLHIEEDHTDRLVFRMVADAPHSLAVEARDRTLGRALDAAGGG